ncbi:MAG: DUF3868 domain-containing protein [Muribaculaceae bacterium]|nr:DUF3868 domain-containing protein [Muribaculaceae bacterium]
MRIKNILLTTTLLMAAAMALPAGAQSNSHYHISGMNVEQTAGNLNVQAVVSPKGYNLKTNQRLEITPVIRSLSGDQSVVLPSFTIAGRNAYYNTLRAEKYQGFLMRSGRGDDLVYNVSVPWEEWMEYSELDFVDASTGCCGVPTMPEVIVPVAELDYRPQEYTPTFHYQVPKAEGSKTRRLEGKAYVTFPVNRTEINPTYMQNPVELRKITSTIDSVKFNPDATVKSITLTGYASPEGAYANNVRLAAGRTEAVKEYVRKQYTFPASVFHTNSVPEDWAGLREYVASSNLSDKDAILTFIDSNVAIEVRNDELRKKFPQSYAFLLKNVYPSLRHTDYAIDFELRSYSDVNEIKRVMKERPRNLSLNELFLAANTYKAGTDEFDEVMELAATLYPESEVANLNAANSALNRGDNDRAKFYLKRIPSSPAATYTSGVIAAIEKDYTGARKMLEDARNQGVAEAAEALQELDRISNRTPGITFAPDFKE